MSKILKIMEILPNRFYFAIIEGKKLPVDSDDNFNITFDNTFDFLHILSYFGPPDLGSINRYSILMEKLLHSMYINKTIVQYTTANDYTKQFNSAFLVGTFMLLKLNYTPKQVTDKLKVIVGPVFYTDTTGLKYSPKLNIIFYFTALQKVVRLKFYSEMDFNLHEYEKLSYEDYYMNWIVPDKLLAFPGPIEASQANQFKLYLDYFLKNNIKAVIRLNNKTYDENRFTESGIKFYNLFFADCTAPSKQIIKAFLEITESTNGAIAIHCKAGYGRTGTLIAAYLIKHFNLSALEAVGWVRICRPGSIVGVQQKCLEENESWLKTDGNIYRMNNLHKATEFNYPLYSYKISQK